MIQNKKLKNLIEKLVAESFGSKGEIKETKVSSAIKVFKKFPSTEAILALTLYQKGLKREIDKTTLEISSPVKLSQEEVKKITSVAKKDYMITSVKTLIDSSLLGGLRIKIGDVVFDDTVAMKIKQLKGAING